MDEQSDIEFLFVLVSESYAEQHKIPYQKTVEFFHSKHIMEKMLAQHEYLHQVAFESVMEFVEKLADENEKLVLYHGSDVLFEKIDLSKSQNRRDFGKGFYTTVLEKQAKDWAYRQMLRNGNSKNYVYRFVFEKSEDLKIKRFDSFGREWLDFIKLNRTKGGVQHDFDVVIGAVADDNTMQTVQLYLLGTLTADEAVERLKFSEVGNQVSFHTEKAIEKLKLIARSDYA